MRAIEELLEAINYADGEHCDWWEAFDSVDEALKILKLAIKEKPEEYEIANFFAIQFPDEDIFATTPVTEFKRHLKILKKSLEEWRDC